MNKPMIQGTPCPPASGASSRTPSLASAMLGVDVSKDHLVCALVQVGTHKTLWQESYANSLPGINGLLRRVPADSSLVVEPTGRYSELVVRQATEKGKTVLLAPPRRAKAFLASIQSRAKAFTHL